MEEKKQEQIRELAAQMVSTKDPLQHALAEGTLELLMYVDELVQALQETTETCCEAMCAVYDGVY